MNLFDFAIPDSGESFDTFLDHRNIKIVRIVSSDRLEEQQYCQDEDEWVVLLEGEATLLVDGVKKELKRGDSLFIPAHTPHTVLRTQNGTLWLAIHIF